MWKKLSILFFALFLLFSASQATCSDEVYEITAEELNKLESTITSLKGRIERIENARERQEKQLKIARERIELLAENLAKQRLTLKKQDHLLTELSNEVRRKTIERNIFIGATLISLGGAIFMFFR